MRSLLFFVLIILQQNLCFATDKDSLSRINLSNKIENLEDQIKEVRRDELNYKIENNLLKETYSNNYDTISIIISVGVLIIGFLGYIGLKDINGIRKEYQNELENLRKTKNEFEIKSKSFDNEKIKLEKELKDIIKQNDEQNNKIKVLEFKEKIPKLLQENQVIQAFDYCKIGLEFSPNDITLLNFQATCHCRMNRLEESKNCFKKALEVEPNSSITIGNYVEVLYFLNELDNANEIIRKHKTFFDEKENGNLYKLFDLIKNYHSMNDDDFKQYIKSFLDFNNLEGQSKLFKTWDLKEAMSFAFNLNNSPKKQMLQNIIWYLDGQISTKKVNERLNLEA